MGLDDFPSSEEMWAELNRLMDGDDDAGALVPAKPKPKTGGPGEGLTQPEPVKETKALAGVA